MEQRSLLKALQEQYNATVPETRQTPERFQTWLNGLTNFELIRAVDAAAREELRRQETPPQAS